MSLSALVLVVLAGLLQPARSHPHVLVDARTVILFDEQGAISGLRHAWTFDLLFSTYAVEGLDADGDGVYSPSELDPLAEVNVTSLAEFDFFSFTYFIGGSERPPPFTDPTDYHLERHDDGRLTLYFTLPYKTSFALEDAELEIDVFDPEYFVAFSMVETDPVALSNAPDACRFDLRLPRELDAATAMTLSQVPAEIRNLPPELAGLTQGLANTIILRCGDVPVDEVASVESVSNPVASASPFGVGPSPQPVPQASGPLGGYFAWIAGQQSRLYRWMADTVEQVRQSPWAALTLLGISFLYGVVHAAGPGHGKVVIGAYALATRQTARRAAFIAFLAAMAQAGTAIAVVAIVIGVFRAASSVVTQSAAWLELASYAIVMSVGLWLCLRVVRRWLTEAQDDGPEPSPASLSAAASVQELEVPISGSESDHGHHHHHDHDCGDPACGHSHLPKPEALEGDFSLSRAAAAVLSVGIRPCSGALIVLVFCFAQGFYLLGILSVLAIAAGTAVTTIAVALAVVGSGSLVEQLSGTSRVAVIMSGLQFLAGLVIVAFGTSLFAATIMRMQILA
ncbi:MAG: DUF1007 family protein [Pseudomonadota bacterium]